MSNPLVSVIIPFYNSSKFIEQTLSSVVKQSYQNIEIIVFDDGSEPTESIALEKTLSKFPTVQLYKGKNGGQSAARNRAIMKSQGKYILPLDSDDIIGVEYIKSAVVVLELSYNIKIVYCKAEYFGERTGLIKLPKFNIKRFAVENQIFSSALYRREDWESSGGYCEGLLFWEDWDFWISLLKNGGIAHCLPEVLFYYRVRQDGMRKSASKKVKQFAIQKLNERHTDFFKNYLGGPLRQKRSWSRLINQITKIICT